MSIALFAALILAAPAVSHDQIPGGPQTRPIAILHATVHVPNGPPIEDATVIFAEGRIQSLGKDVQPPSDCEAIDATGHHIYPGLFDAFTHLGLSEIDSVSAMRDFSETGDVNAAVRTWVAINADSELLPVTRSNGVLLALSAPIGGLISGQSAVIQLDGWTYADMLVRGPTAMHIRWPSQPSALVLLTEGHEEQGSESRNRAAQQLRLLNETFDQAIRYHAMRSSDPQTPSDANLEALGPVLAREIPVIVSANRADDIQAAVAWAVRRQLRLVIYGGYDAEQCAALLREHDVPVIVSAVYRLPQRRKDAYDAAYTLPERLRAAGVRFCISGMGAEQAWNVRNLPYHAATAVAYGLPQEEGVKAITVYPAEILGVADRVGSLAVGLHATLFIADGNILETPTKVTHAFIQGRRVDLDNKHEKLYRKYQHKP
jgi:imidazolonepropionase-like amidohydrolase